MERQHERRRVMMSLVAEEAADRAEIVLSTAPALLDIIDAVAPDDPCAGNFNTLIEPFPQFGNLSVIDVNGVALCSVVAGGAGSSVADRDWFQQLRDNDAGHVQSTAYFGPVMKQWILASAKRREDADGNFAGAWMIGVPVTSLAYSLDRSGLPKDSEVALLDASGRVFASQYWTMLDPSVVTDWPGRPQRSRL